MEIIEVNFSKPVKPKRPISQRYVNEVLDDFFARRSAELYEKVKAWGFVCPSCHKRECRGCID